jgi:hypothetical protein
MLPSVAAVPKVMDTAVSELESPMFTKPKFELVGRWLAGSTRKLSVTVRASA